MKQTNLIKKNIILLLLGRTTSLFGASIYLIALPLYILKLKNNLALSGMFFALSNIPSVILSPLLGPIIERANRKKCIVVCDLCTSLIHLLLFILCINSKISIIVLLIASMLINVIASIFDISSKVLFTEVTDATTITKYNGIKSFFDNATALIAPIVGTLLFGIFGFNMILITIAICYFLSALQEIFITYNGNVDSVEDSSASFVSQLVDGIHFILEKKAILKMFILVMTLNFFVANNDEIINPGILIQKYKISERLYGITSSFLVVGTLIASLYIFKGKKLDIKKYIKVFFITNSFLMISIGTVSLIMNAKHSNEFFVYFTIIQVLIGFVTTCINVTLGSYFQISIPVNYQARFFSLLSFSSNLLIPLGIAYTGCFSSHLAPDITYIINNTCVIIITAVLLKNNPLNQLDNQ